MSGAIRVRHGRLHFFVRETLKRRRVPAELASRSADAMVAANLVGEDRDGVAWLPDLAAGISTRHLNPAPAMKIVASSGGVAVLDGDNGPGPAVAHRAMTEAIMGANRHGVGAVAVRGSNRPGMAAHFAAMTLPHQMAGVALTGAGTLTEAAHGGGVIGIAAPTAETAAPLVLNLELGTGERELALLLALETLVLLGGGALAPELVAGDRPEPTHRGAGHLFLAFRVRAFAPWAGFRNRMVERLEHLRRGGLRYPGQDAAELEDERRAFGIPLGEKTAGALERLAYGLGMHSIWDGLALPARGRPARGEPAAPEPVEEEPAAEKPVAEEQAVDEADAGELRAEEADAEEADADEPVAEETLADEPARRRLTRKKTAARKTAARPATRKQATERRVTRKKTVARTAAREKTIEETERGAVSGAIREILDVAGTAVAEEVGRENATARTPARKKAAARTAARKKAISRAAVRKKAAARRSAQTKTPTESAVRKRAAARAAARKRAAEVAAEKNDAATTTEETP